ncbi:MAG: hypothetical protein JW888_11645 [Pirellulales bacterium]|nr:hypothetical protein [Pirellulales bacterium]
MQQVRIFKGVESDIASLEKEVNTWIRHSGAKIVGITGNIAPQSESGASGSGALGGGHFAASDVLLIVLYESAA